MKNTHLNVNGNDGPGISLETTQVDEMMGDQLYGHPDLEQLKNSYKPLTIKVKESIIKELEKNLEEIKKNIKRK